MINTKVIALATATLFSSPVWADTFEVTVINLTAGQAFTPRLAITHSGGNAFTLGSQALPELASIAESGNTAPMQEFLKSSAISSFVSGVQVSDGLLNAGNSETFTLSI